MKNALSYIIVSEFSGCERECLTVMNLSQNMPPTNSTWSVGSQHSTQGHLNASVVRENLGGGFSITVHARFLFKIVGF